MIVFTPQGVYLFGSDLKGTKLKLCFAYGLQDVHVVVSVLINVHLYNILEFLVSLQFLIVYNF